MQVTIDRPNLAGLMNSVCAIETRKDKKYGGHGVFLLPDIILTAWHIVEGSRNITVIGPDGRTAEIVRGSRYAKKMDNYDLATVELSRPLASDVASTFTDSELFMRNMKGYLTSRFTGSAKCHHAGINHDNPVNNKKRPWMEDYLCDEKIIQGYSGSPVFDARGKLVSVVSTISRDNHTGNTLEVPPSPDFPNGLFRFEGPKPEDTATFVRRALDI